MALETIVRPYTTSRVVFAKLRASLSLEDILPGLAKVPIVGILRRCPPDRSPGVAGAARDSGLTVLEVTLDSEDATRQIETLIGEVPDLAVGAGTVLTSQQAEAAIGAGASFLVTPVLVPEVIHVCLERGVPCFPGAATPTEIWKAHEEGATAVKVFPARELGGPGYLAALRQPLAGVPLIPTGGVSSADIRGYLEAGAVAVGMGGPIFPSDAISHGDLSRIRTLVSEAVEQAR